jgi:hypothetical protein
MILAQRREPLAADNLRSFIVRQGQEDNDVVELIRQTISGERCSRAPSNLAVDNLLNDCWRQESAVRLGHPRVLPELRATLDVLSSRIPT